MPHDTNRYARALRELAPEDALALMASVPIGRVVFTLDALPAILPVRFRLDRGTLAFRLAADRRVHAALHDSVCAFEADAWDVREHDGWTVTVTGRVSPVDESHEGARLAEMLPPTWESEHPHRFFRIVPEVVAGRLLRAAGRPVPA
ncbi:pyridoxamine 5'-phosphate oxidase family protein [Embleya sp. MST-111070]|uniref:pyridoxamine 5'-phosphate oxidase family protein n=1 Tax=Embleya sp. MST-111070 TaxID=3398231 RepID=UPI003F73E300